MQGGWGKFFEVTDKKEKGMKRKINQMLCGFAVTALAAFAVVACDSDVLSVPDIGSTNSSADQSKPASSSSEIVLQSSSSSAQSSSSELRLSSMCNAFLPECGYSVEELCRMGRTYYCQNSSSSVARSSSSNELCKHVTDVKCEACPPGEKCICHPCDPNKERESYDCTTYADLKCIDGEWQTSKQFCPNGRWTTSCGDYDFYQPICCTGKWFGTCKHISDYDGMTAQGDCVDQNGSTAVDCETGDNYQCKNNNWEKVSCLNIKPDECKPGMGGCGYRLCDPKGIWEIADCETGVLYYCDGEKWEVNRSDNNMRCAQGELEYCDLCYREGEFEGRYKCEGGKWRKYGMGNETCVHISDLKCEWGMLGCGACDSIYNGSLAKDCVTGYPYGCYNGYWSEVLVQQPMPCESRSINGTACTNEGSTEVVDDCAFVCNDGAYTYAPAPM